MQKLWRPLTQRERGRGLMKLEDATSATFERGQRDAAL